MENYTFLTSPPNQSFMGGPFSRVAGSSSLDFYTDLMKKCLGYGCVGFEIDFLDFNYWSFVNEASAIVPGEFTQFLTGLSSAGANAGVPVQLCMPVPSDVLSSVHLPGISNIRASDDNDFSYAEAQRWKIGLTSMLHGSIDIRPFADNVWTFNGCAEAFPPTYYPANYCQNASELNVAVSILSTGPVGIADKGPFVNSSLALMTCATNGVLLKPSLPAAPIDAYFWYSIGNGPSSSNILQNLSSEVWQAPSFIPVLSSAEMSKKILSLTGLNYNGLNRYGQSFPGKPVFGTFPNITQCPYTSVLVVDVPGTFTLFDSDLSPSLAVGTTCNAQGYVAVAWSPGIASIQASCSDGVTAINCIIPLTSNGIALNTGTTSYNPARGAPHPFELYSFAPIYSNGWTLLGELNKFVRVSPVRFTAITYVNENPPRISVIVDGAASEEISVHFITPSTSGLFPMNLENAYVRKVDVTFPSNGGSVLITCTGIGSTASCSTQLL
jgi:hypothetical protein